MHFRTRIQFGVARARPFARKCSIFSRPRLESATPIGRAAAFQRETARALERDFSKNIRARAIRQTNCAYTSRGDAKEHLAAPTPRTGRGFFSAAPHPRPARRLQPARESSSAGHVRRDAAGWRYRGASRRARGARAGPRAGSPARRRGARARASVSRGSGEKEDARTPAARALDRSKSRYDSYTFLLRC